jgi:glycosyltransferase involved in cell wall biosynthesis
MRDGRIRVLHVITCLHGGAGWHVYQLARNLDPKRFDVRLAFGPGYPLDARIERECIPHVHMGWRRTLQPIALARGASDLNRLLAAERFDIVHAHCSVAGVLGRVGAAWHRVPHVVFSVHALASRDYQPAWRKRLFLQVERAMDRFTERYFVFTEGLKDQIVARGISRPGKIQVIPHGVDIPEAPGPVARACARARLGLAAGELAIVVAGRLEPQKGLIYLLRAFPSVLRRVPSARLILLGDGPLRAGLEREARRGGIEQAVRFLGWRDDVADLLPGTDVFCMPSLWEALPYSLIEAMVCRLPIVASAIDSMPDVLGHGSYGALVPPADSDRLADALVGLLRHPEVREELAAAARCHASATYSLSSMIARYEAAYSEIVGSGTVNPGTNGVAPHAVTPEYAGRES